MKIAFVHTGKAFLPEIPAYRSYLEKNHQTTIELEDYKQVADHSDLDLVFRFGGMIKTDRSLRVPEIHEYHSASTTRFPLLKNIIKSFASSKPQGRVFLNEFVKSQYFFPDKTPFIYRDMGASSNLLNCTKMNKKDFDIVYAGSITNRPGLLESLTNLARSGFKIGLAGNASREESDHINSCPGITYLGRLAPYEVPDLISRGKYGLNYCPDIYPLNQQTSSKVIEYLAAGLPIISNKYRWIEKHKKQHNYEYIDIREASSPEKLFEQKKTSLIKNDRSIFTWDNVLSNCKFLEFIQKTINQNASI